MNKANRLRRAKKIRAKIALSNIDYRLVIHRTNKHMYASIFNVQGSEVATSSSTVEREISSFLVQNGDNVIYSNTVAAAAKVGGAIAIKALALGIKKVALDRSGFHFHGRVKALAEAARQAGLQF